MRSFALFICLIFPAMINCGCQKDGSGVKTPDSERVETKSIQKGDYHEYFNTVAGTCQF